MDKLLYRCENEFGSDPCEFAQSNRTIHEGETIPAMDGGTPRCPGKTLSGKICNKELVPIRIDGRRLPKWAVFGSGGLVLSALIIVILWYLTIPGKPVLQANPNPLIFPQTDTGVAMADIRIRNDGESELIIDRIEANPSVFSASEGKTRVASKGVGTLSIRFKSLSSEMVEGTLVLHSNAKISPTIISLIANRDPWWVYRKLETTSKTLLKEP